MPVVRIELSKGRTIAQKRELVKSITDAVVKSTGVKPENVWIIINEFEPDNFSSGGHLQIDKYDASMLPSESD